MDIESFGGEFHLIDAITRAFGNPHGARLTVGDDAAVVDTGQGDYRVFTTDLLVEGEHFDRRWSTPAQIGIKTLEVNVSDVAAMGAKPEFLLLNLALPRSTPAEFVLELYRAMRERCDAHGITLLGGDTTRGPVVMISATLTGRTANPILRSGASPGDLIAVTGDVGAAAAAVASYRAGQVPLERPRLRHLEPRARIDAVDALSRFAAALVDISDGVASEVRHICERSGVGARVDAARLPIHPDTDTVARTVGLTGIECGLSGGEDFELLFALPPHREAPLRSRFADFTVIGEFLPLDEGLVVVHPDGTRAPLPAGYDHFAHDTEG
jgi:thiamine-monophosphate kinase